MVAARDFIARHNLELADQERLATLEAIEKADTTHKVTRENANRANKKLERDQQQKRSELTQVAPQQPTSAAALPANLFADDNDRHILQLKLATGYQKPLSKEEQQAQQKMLTAVLGRLIRHKKALDPEAKTEHLELARDHEAIAYHDKRMELHMADGYSLSYRDDATLSYGLKPTVTPTPGNQAKKRKDKELAAQHFGELAASLILAQHLQPKFSVNTNRFTTFAPGPLDLPRFNPKSAHKDEAIWQNSLRQVLLQFGSLSANGLSLSLAPDLAKNMLADPLVLAVPAHLLKR